MTGKVLFSQFVWLKSSLANLSGSSALTWVPSFSDQFRIDRGCTQTIRICYQPLDQPVDRSFTMFGSIKLRGAVFPKNPAGPFFCLHMTDRSPAVSETHEARFWKRRCRPPGPRLPGPSLRNCFVLCWCYLSRFDSRVKKKMK